MGRQSAGWIERHDRFVKEHPEYDDPRIEWYPMRTVSCQGECVERGILKRVPNIGQRVECGACGAVIAEDEG